MIKKNMKSEKAFMCTNCSEQIRIIGDKLNFKDFCMEIFLTHNQKCCNMPKWVYQYSRKLKE